LWYDAAARSAIAQHTDRCRDPAVVAPAAQAARWLAFPSAAPIGPYIVDFFCPAAKLVIEVDGGQHAMLENEDAWRTRWLEARGYRVVRFWNNEVLANTDGVILVILESLRANPPP
jgi:very-short-patch-repair endonuclease